MTTGKNGSVSAITDADELASTHMSAHKSARSREIEIIRSERRRRWPPEHKRAIVAETRIPGASLAGIARKHGIGTGLLYSWRRCFLGEPPATTPAFARAELPDASTELVPGNWTCS
jgi:transposase